MRASYLFISFLSFLFPKSSLHCSPPFYFHKNPVRWVRLTERGLLKISQQASMANWGFKPVFSRSLSDTLTNTPHKLSRCKLLFLFQRVNPNLWQLSDLLVWPFCCTKKIPDSVLDISSEKEVENLWRATDTQCRPY